MGAHEPQAKQHHGLAAVQARGYAPTLEWNSYGLKEKRHTGEEFGRRRRRGLDAVGNFDGICGVLGPLPLLVEQEAEGAGGPQGNPGSHHAIDAN
jgi:hypothetical protein